ncbi:MAG: molybdenum cofactor guanylyltransferase [Lachnospiraceae bacterium]|nr:molybdenum cofactor guanylyltransferase [Lachnospiraceae bacterium]
MKTENVSAIIMAGGASERMGTDKTELKLGGKTLVEIQVEKMKKLGITDIMLSGYGKEMDGARSVADVYAGKGPLGGIHACLKAAKNSSCLVVSADNPLVPAEVLSELIEAHTGPATVLSHGEHIEPLIAVYDTSLEARAEELIKNDDFSIRRMSANSEVKKVDYKGDADLLVNCNEPKDFEKAQSLWK